MFLINCSNNSATNAIQRPYFSFQELASACELTATHHVIVQLNVQYKLIVATRGRNVFVMVTVDTAVWILVSMQDARDN